MPVYSRYRQRSGKYGYRKKKGNIFYRRGANKAYRMAKRALSLVNPEFKFLDTLGTQTVIPEAAGTIVPLTNVAQGDTSSTRTGDSIKLTSLTMKANISMSTSSVQTHCVIFLVEDKQTNSALYTTSQLLTDVTQHDSIVSSLNLDNKYRFRVIKRWNFTLEDNGKQSKYIKFYHRFHEKYHLRYDGNAGTIADLSSKSLSLLFIGNEGTNRPNITFNIRIRYLDG